jgi:hypothetical protein
MLSQTKANDYQYSSQVKTVNFYKSVLVIQVISLYIGKVFYYGMNAGVPQNSLVGTYKMLLFG